MTSDTVVIGESGCVNFTCPSNYFKSNNFPRDDHSSNKTGFDHQKHYHLHSRTNSHRRDPLKHHHVLPREREQDKDKEWYEWGDSSARISPPQQNSSKFLPAVKVWENNDPTPLLFILEHLWISAKMARHNSYFTDHHELWGMHSASFPCTVVKHSDRTTYTLSLTPPPHTHTHIHMYLHSYTDIRSTCTLQAVHSPCALS